MTPEPYKPSLVWLLVDLFLAHAQCHYCGATSPKAQMILLRKWPWRVYAHEICHEVRERQHRQGDGA